MTTIRELLLLIGRKLGEQPDGLKKNQSIKAASRLSATLDNWQDIVIDLPMEQPKETSKSKKKLAEPTPEFFEELNEQSADEEDGASVGTTKAKKTTSSK